MTGAATLSVTGLAKAFGGSPVLTGLDLEVPAGSLTAVLGPSGCGKTTLLRLLAGFERADGGSIRVGERVLRDEQVDLAPERRAIGFVAQEGALFPNLDVAANIGFGLSRSERRGGRIGELLDLVGLSGLADRFPHQLSGGQQQRVALARALAPSPAVVLLDEPFDALDAGLRAHVRAEVRAVLREAGATALLVTHDQQEALSLADLVAIMRDGRIVQSADPETLYRDPVDPQVALFVGEAVLLDADLHGHHADTALGRLPVRPAPTAEQRGLIMLRPEQITCRSRPMRGAPRGRVTATEFYGHDATASISLDDRPDVKVTARTVGHLLPRIGDHVSVLVEGSALAYPASHHNGSSRPAGWRGARAFTRKHEGTVDSTVT
jgi:iron(III) transport system ATP-binding protein